MHYRSPVATALLFGALPLLVNGCSVPGAKTIPSFRLEVALLEPMNEVTLYDVANEMAVADGFIFAQQNGPEIEKRSLLGEPNTVWAYEWFRAEPLLAPGNYTVAFIWRYYDREVSAFEFVLYHEAPTWATEKEWLMFKRWKERLEQRFPTATMSIISHPAKHSRPKDLIVLSEKTGLDLPPRYVQRHERWEARPWYRKAWFAFTDSDEYPFAINEVTTPGRVD
jgi:hypothetical protein